MNTIRLHGCRPEPLLSYLKALGVFRLVAEQGDPSARASWKDDVLVLHTTLSEAELLVFFTHSYKPTPIIAPWNGEDFFRIEELASKYQLAKAPKGPEVIVALMKSESERLALYRDAIKQTLEVISSLNLVREKPKEKGKSAQLKMKGKDLGSKEVKALLINALRSNLHEDVVDWMDAALVLETRSGFSPLLGTGGNDGNLDFALNFLQRLVDIGFTGESLSPQTEGWLKNALFGIPTDGLLKNAIGQFDPGRAGGPNATQGLDGDSRVNPWEYVLMLEGSLLMAGSVTRRLDVNARDKASFPFTVNASAVGNGSLSESEDARGEIWLPLWRNPAGLSELRHIFAEGRAQLGKRQAKNAVDFARAIAGLGVDRGLTGFTRYSFLKRFGKNYLATSLGHFETHTTAAHTNLLAELDEWLESFRRACSGETAQPRFGAALRRLDNAIFFYSRHGGTARFGEIVRALGRCEQELALNHDKPGQIDKRTISPVLVLSAEWLVAVQEDSPEFRIALALAALRGTGAVGALRTNLEMAVRKKWGWDWAAPAERYAAVWSGTSLPRNLQAVLERRMVDATRARLDNLPLESSFPANADDITLFIAGQTDDARLEEWLWGLMLFDLEQAQPADLAPAAASTPAQPLPRAYAVLKLLFLPHYSALQTADGHLVRPEPAILSHLRAGRLNDACQLAARRLRTSGHVSMPGPVTGGRERPSDFTVSAPARARLAAALLIPLANPGRIKAMVLRPDKQSQD